MASTQGAQIDAIMEELGWFGRYTKVQFFLTFSYVLAAGGHMLSIVFLAKSMDHKCATPRGTFLDNWTQEANRTRFGDCFIEAVGSDNSTQLSSCFFGFEYEEPRDRSIVSETLMIAGMGLGSALFTTLADKFGRKPIFLVTVVGVMVLGISSSQSPNYTTFAVLRFFLGAFHVGMSLAGMVIVIELLATRRRTLAAMADSFIWTVCIALLVPIAYLMREQTWRHLELTLGLFSLPTLLYYWVGDESLRWLAVNGRFDEFERVLRKAARMNGKDEEKILEFYRERILPDSYISLTRSKSDETAEDCTEREAAADTETAGDTAEPPPQVVPYGCLTIFRHKRIMITLLITCFLWLATVLTFFGLSLTSTELLEDPYLGFLLNVLVDMPIAFLLILLNKLGRRRCVLVFLSTAGVALLASVTLSTLADSGPARVASVAFTLVGKFAASTTFSTLHLYTPELFPTNIRNAAVGVSSLAGRVGGMAAPFSKTLARQAKWAPGVVFGVLCLGAGLCTCFLPETMGRELPQRPQDIAGCSAPKRSNRRTNKK